MNLMSESMDVLATSLVLEGVEERKSECWVNVVVHSMKGRKKTQETAEKDRI